MEPTPHYLNLIQGCLPMSLSAYRFVHNIETINFLDIFFFYPIKVRVSFKFPVEKTLANSSLSFTGGIAPMHMLVSMYYCIYMFSYGPYGPEIKHYYYYYYYYYYYLSITILYSREAYTLMCLKHNWTLGLNISRNAIPIPHYRLSPSFVTADSGPCVWTFICCSPSVWGRSYADTKRPLPAPRAVPEQQHVR